MLDEVLFFGYRNVVLDDPLFIVSSPRSGTTYLHRLLSLDTDKYALMYLHHTLVPSITFYKLTDGLYFLDSLIGHPFKYVFLKISSLVFRGWDGIHKTGLDVPEEDEGLWFTMMLSPAVILLSPFYDKFDDLSILDNWDKNQKITFMSYYHNCLLRMQYHFGRDKTLLIKSVMASGRVNMYHNQFSSSQFIYLHRDPIKTVASYVSMFTKTWDVHSKDIVDQPTYYTYASLAPIQFYHHIHNIGIQNFSHVKYLDYTTFVEDPLTTIKAIYQFTNSRIDEEYKDKLEQEIEKNKIYRSTHKYSLQQFGLRPQDIYAQLKIIK